jgi:hypothetical protein
MDPITLTLTIMSIVFAGGGIWTLLAAKATAKATKEAAQAAAQAANRQAATADWSGLMTYWQSEIKELRDDNKGLEVRLILLEERRDADLQHIADLENHIWQQLPPPPPIRRLPRNDPPKAP